MQMIKGLKNQILNWLMDQFMMISNQIRPIKMTKMNFKSKKRKVYKIIYQFKIMTFRIIMKMKSTDRKGKDLEITKEGHIRVILFMKKKGLLNFYYKTS